MQHCPAFMFDVAAARAAGEFLSSEIGLERIFKKYFEAFSEHSLTCLRTISMTQPNKCCSFWQI